MKGLEDEEEPEEPEEEIPNDDDEDNYSIDEDQVDPEHRSPTRLHDASNSMKEVRNTAPDLLDPASKSDQKILGAKDAHQQSSASKAEHILGSSQKLKYEESMNAKGSNSFIARPTSGGTPAQHRRADHYNKPGQPNAAQQNVVSKRHQRPSDIQRKSSRQSSEFYRSSSQVSHEQQQQAVAKLMEGNLNASGQKIASKEEIILR